MSIQNEKEQAEMMLALVELMQAMGMDIDTEAAEGNLEEAVDPTPCELAGFPKGTRIIVTGYSGKLYPGTVVKDHGDMRPTVEFDDGDVGQYPIMDLEKEGRLTLGEQGQFTLIPGSIIVIQYKGLVHTVDASHSLFEMIATMCQDGDFEDAVRLAEPAKAIQEFSKGNVTIKGETVYYKGDAVKTGLAEAILRLMGEGDDGFKKLVAFLEKVEQNPSYKSRMELFGFIKAADIEITESGDMICWKRIRKNWTDSYTGQIDNSIGAVVRMERSLVNDNSNQTCSAGLHVCAKSYLGHFYGDRVVKVLVNPKHVVSIPVDYNDAKMRCEEYVVISEVSREEWDG